MKKLLLTIVFVITALFWTAIAMAQVSPKFTSFGMPYLEFKNPDCVGCPVIVFLCGSGERGYGGSDLNKLYNVGIPHVLKLAGKTSIDGFSYILCPQQVPTKGWNQDIVKVFTYFNEAYDCSAGFFPTGLSLGGEGTWAGSYSTIPDSLITAMVPVSAKGDYNGAKTTASRQTPVWALHGKSDTTMPVSEGQRPVNGMNDVKANPAPTFTLITGGTHSNNTWDVVYSLTPREDHPEMGGITVYTWMLRYVKHKPIPPNPNDTGKIWYYSETEKKLVFLTEGGKELRVTPDD